MIDKATPSQSEQPRKIIHADCDSFYASVEMRDDPSLRDHPVAVGGSPDQRGVVATCNYRARAFGVRSAMPMSRALRLCPDLVIVRGNMAKYAEVSGQVREIFERFTDIIEPLSLDEAFLDVSANTEFDGSATRMAEALRRSVREELKITISAGIAPNKFLAKIASDWNKPDGQFTIAPADVADFVVRLPVEKLFGVGSVTAARMHAAGLKTCGDLQQLELTDLTRGYGKFGGRLYNLCRGIDERELATARQRKSVSVERTYATDVATWDLCLAAGEALFAELERRIERTGTRARIEQSFVKVRFNDFTTTTAAGAGKDYHWSKFAELLQQAWQRKAQPVRLLGLGVRLAHPAVDRQLVLFEDDN